MYAASFNGVPADLPLHQCILAHLRLYESHAIIAVVVPATNTSQPLSLVIAFITRDSLYLCLEIAIPVKKLPLLDV